MSVLADQSIWSGWVKWVGQSRQVVQVGWANRFVGHGGLDSSLSHRGLVFVGQTDLSILVDWTGMLGADWSRLSKSARPIKLD